jgi:octaprenyl-diphosphate synthase
MSDLKSQILEQVQDDLERIEVALADNLRPHVELVHQIANHILFAGGKRLRPLLSVLCARLCGQDGDSIIRFSVIFEYLHAATLIHDDVVDGASLRRGRKVANVIWGGATAVLVGDFLLARSLALAAEANNTEVIRTIAGITENMSQGEIDQLARKGDVQLTESDYMEVIRRKTAVLFQGACRASALVAKASTLQINALSDYGYHLGMAFQMADDLLDYTADTAVLGKRAGADLREGKLTLPVIHTLKAAGENDRRWILTLVERKDFTVNEFKRLLELLNHHGGIDHTRDMAAEHVQKAKAALAEFDTSQPRRILLQVADYALVRKL